ncbi:MAG: hypothetical protein AMJ78_07845 [Omnitrophica WOR_2 bacterium SM23_29]|nr:MAG: hypothetical protein AMJ78_07845 [Omnitrophica WOR_2 bacterium SM23_29]
MITVVGSSNTDFCVKVDRLPKRGQTVLGSDFFIAAGGKGANQAAQIAKLGAKVAFIARVGRDHFGDRSLENLASLGIDTRYIIRDREHPSGAAVIFIDRKGGNQIAVAPSSNRFLNISNIKRASGAIKRSKVLLLQLEVPLDAVKKAIEIARSSGAKVILNPAPFKKLDNSLLRKVDILVPNETEAEGLTGVKVKDLTSAIRAGGILLKRNIRFVIITLGRSGCVLIDKFCTKHIPAPKVKAIDTTAAGDSFCGALAVAISEGKDLIEAARFASCCAAVSVTRLGAQPSLPNRKEAISFFKI